MTAQADFKVRNKVVWKMRSTKNKKKQKQKKKQKKNIHTAKKKQSNKTKQTNRPNQQTKQKKARENKKTQALHYHSGNMLAVRSNHLDFHDILVTSFDIKLSVWEIVKCVIIRSITGKNLISSKYTTQWAILFICCQTAMFISPTAI